MTDAADLLTLRAVSGARAMGLLTALVRHGHIPAHHLDHARDIIAEWDATCTQPQPQPEKHDEPL